MLLFLSLSHSFFFMCFVFSFGNGGLESLLSGGGGGGGGIGGMAKTDEQMRQLARAMAAAEAKHDAKA
jgi:hypothetical protein